MYRRSYLIWSPVIVVILIGTYEAAHGKQKYITNCSIVIIVVVLNYVTLLPVVLTHPRIIATALPTEHRKRTTLLLVAVVLYGASQITHYYVTY